MQLKYLIVWLKYFRRADLMRVGKYLHYEIYSREKFWRQKFRRLKIILAKIWNARFHRTCWVMLVVHWLLLYACDNCVNWALCRCLKDNSIPPLVSRTHSYGFWGLTFTPIWAMFHHAFVVAWKGRTHGHLNRVYTAQIN